MSTTITTTIKLHPSHYHDCYACGVTLVCCCDNRRSTDRVTGAARKRLLCIACIELEKALMEMEAEAKSRRQPL